MKKGILLTLLSIGGATMLFTGCSKDDTTPPSISLNGSTSEVISLQSGAWTDPGATATDDEDGSVTVTSNSSATNPNPNAVGTYTITYSATDAAGNVGTAIRTVRVKNDAEFMAGTYAVSDNVAGTIFTYNQTLSVDNSTNNKIHFSLFADYANNTDIYGTVNPADSTLTVPDQSSGHDIGTLDIANPCSVQRHNFRSTAYLHLSNGFKLNYVDSLTTGSGCAGVSTPCEATFSK